MYVLIKKIEVYCTTLSKFIKVKEISISYGNCCACPFTASTRSPISFHEYVNLSEVEKKEREISLKFMTTIFPLLFIRHIQSYGQCNNFIQINPFLLNFGY